MNADRVHYVCADIELKNELITLHPLKALYIHSLKMLVCSDLHIGKGAHFRKNGIALPAMLNKNNFWNLVEVIEYFDPLHILFLGDLVHSSANKEWDDFVDFMDQYPFLQKTLVKGNHDILPDENFTQMGMRVHDRLIAGPFIFSHEPQNEEKTEYYGLSGHIHPAVVLGGKAGQSLRLSCFYFGENGGILPAFGEFTGSATIRPLKSDRVFVIAGKKVMGIN